MRTLILSALLCCIGPITIIAQCDNHADLEVKALKAYLENDPDQWDALINEAEALPQNTENARFIAKILFGATGTAFSREDNDRADDYLDAMEAPLDYLLDQDKDDPVANGLYSGYLGMLIARKPIKGMLYGGKAGRMAKKGVEKGPNSPIAHYFLGSNLYYTPKTWGGDPEEAVTMLEKALTFFPAGTDGCDWFYLQAHALLGQAQTQIGDKAAARRTYLSALQLQPEFNWVKNVLLPALDKAK